MSGDGHRPDIACQHVVMTEIRPRAWLEIDAGILRHNARTLRHAIPATTALGLLVKANGYGHGLVVAARAGVAGGADRLIVVSIEEALELRAAGIDVPILVVYALPDAALETAALAGIEVSVSGPDVVDRAVEAWTTVAGRLPDARLAVHLEVDTGMGRGGIAPADVLAAIEAMEAAPRIDLVGIWTHLADGSDPERSARQVERFEHACAAIVASGRSLPVRHIAATEGLVCETSPTLDMVRIGLGYYGELGVDVVPSPAMSPIAADLRPALAVKARPIRVEDLAAGSSVGYGSEWTATRPSRIATLPIGYADGWTRAYWPGSDVLVRGRRVPLVGRVSMDSVCADVTDLPGVTPEDEFVMLGAQGDERIGAVELARRRGSIPNEVLCDFGPRLARFVMDDDAAQE